MQPTQPARGPGLLALTPALPTTKATVVPGETILLSHHSLPREASSRPGAPAEAESLPGLGSHRSPPSPTAHPYFSLQTTGQASKTEYTVCVSQVEALAVSGGSGTPALVGFAATACPPKEKITFHFGRNTVWVPLRCSSLSNEQDGGRREGREGEEAKRIKMHYI